MSMNIAFLTTAPQTLTQDLCDLANLEGHLLSVRARMRLDAGNEKGEGEVHSPNQCEVAHVAHFVWFCLEWGTLRPFGLRTAYQRTAPARDRNRSGSMAEQL